MSQAFNYVDAFVQDKGRGVHNLDADTLKIMLTNAVPGSFAVKADLTEISAGSGYTAGGTAVASNDYSQTAGVAKLTGNKVTFTASGGTIGPFRYAWLYNDTPSSPADPLIGYWDYASSITLQDGESFTVGNALNAGNWDATNPILSETHV